MHLLLALAFAWLSAIVNADTPPRLPAISSLSFSGNGCPQNGTGERAVTATGDWNELDFTFHHFTATMSGAGPASRTTNCQAHITANGTTPGWQVSPSNVTVKGFTMLQPGTTLTLFITAFWSQSASQTVTVTRNYENTGTGPMTDIIADVAELPLWSPCSDDAGRQGILNINFRAALTGDQAGNGTTGYFGPLEIAGAEIYPVAETIDFEWRTCR